MRVPFPGLRDPGEGKARMSERKETERQIERIDGLVRDLEAVADPALRSTAKELVQALMALHGGCLERMLEIIDQADGAGKTIIDNLGRDDLVRSLLLLYGLHPVDLRTRVLQALEKTRPYIHSHGGNVELVGIDDAGQVTLKLEGNCSGCPSSSATLEIAVERSIYDAAPDVTGIVVQGMTQDQAQTIAFVPLSSLQPGGRNGKRNTDDVEWEEVFGLEDLAPGALRIEEVGGQAILFCRLGETFFAYGEACPGCGQPLRSAQLEGTLLACSLCNSRYDIVRAGRGVDLTSLHLEPVPLLIEDGHAKVAVELSKAQRSAK
jgi:Fe-S cluster biogenesis protein NfuA/nitrite reductase/ring-hydroxylating ferredoxin subunit